MKLGMVRAGGKALSSCHPASLQRAGWDQQKAQNSGGWEPPRKLRVLQS